MVRGASRWPRVTFTQAVDRVLERISHQPAFYPEVWLNVRESIVRGYPYCIYYREESDSVVVLAVFHTSRNPAVWQRRN
ncbi:MAG: type II toxin-antitoxin system RelE/ParE family toxin [Planctomycetaceae bacterium]|nr:type II toxin-antitoxin system RelE/ParE family toxin [Planctomycetaceae bacterium]